jgi:hypothetical protein
MPAFIVQLPDGVSFGNKNRDIVVFAEDAANATEFAKAAYDAGTDATWDLATPEEIDDAADYLGWSANVQVTGAVAQTVPVNVTHVGIAADDVDDVAAALVILLNAHPDIAASTYDALTNILTIAAVGDGIGDGAVVMTWTPPGARRGTIPSYVGTIVDEGIAAAVLTVQLNTDAVAIGRIVAELPSRV